MGRIVIDPITRIEGHLKIEAVVENGEVKEARSSGTLFRGFELILQGRDPRDAARITQRICGVCPASHGTASCLALDDAFGVEEIPPNGRIIRNLILGSNFIQSHILHFYHLAALDYVDLTRLADYEGSDPTLRSVKDFIGRGELGPFAPRYEGDYRLPEDVNLEMTAHYIKAFEMRRRAHQMLAIFGGKMPHNVGVVPGGVTQAPTVDKIAAFLWHLNEIRDFIDNVYILDVLALAESYPDYLEIGAGCGRVLAYGGFEEGGGRGLFVRGIVSSDLELKEVDPAKISEDVRHSWYDDSCGGRHPNDGRTLPKWGKEGAYSWLKSPRYDGEVHEVGPLARVLVNYAKGDPRAREVVDSALGELRAEPRALFSVLGRHLARALDCKLVADAMAEWVLKLKPGEPAYIEYALPEEGEGMGLTEAPRGALGHWVEIKGGKIANYQCVVPTTWNASPRDARGQPGPIEQAIEGTKIRDEENPFEIVRIVRSFDPCLACAVHLITPKGRKLGEFRVV